VSVLAYAAHEAGASLLRYEYEPGPLGRLQVDVAVTHCGVCHTDVGQIDDEFGHSRFPVVAGHEAVGIVEAIGTDVDPEALPVGTRVGIGAIAGSCFRCRYCLSGRQQWCPHRDDTVLRGDRGAFAHHVRAGDWRHVHPIPHSLASEHAAPLMCAGTTVFSPLLRRGVLPIHRVAVVGVGGLGHLALQFLAAWGCDVTAISTSLSKEADARRFGATSVIASGEHGALAAARDSFDFVLSTVSADLPWDDYLGLLRPGGTLSVVGVPDHALSVGQYALLPQEKVLAGGIPSAVEETRQMLTFAARHGIAPQIELFPVGDIDAALDRVRQGRARYRAVLEM
jgi:alcohol/geraniol dehydrogenase (NADP+)